jgi:hypothetical protein
MAPQKRYRAIRCCHYKGFYYTPGDEFVPSPEELSNPDLIPEHFVSERDFSDELVLDAETEDRNRQVFIKPVKADEVSGPAEVK